MEYNKLELFIVPIVCIIKITHTTHCTHYSNIDLFL